MFPGQGIQKQGMGQDLFDHYSEMLKLANEITGLSIDQLCLQNSNNRLNDTRYAQLAIYVVNAMYCQDKIQREKILPNFCIGHSLGELNALLCAGVIDFETGLRLVQKRGELMAKANGGAMAAIVGLTQDQLTQHLQQYAEQGVIIANINTANQMVLSGEKNAVAMQLELLKSNYPNIRCILLNTSGAFHSPYMREAAEEYRDYLANFQFNEPSIPVLANASLELYTASNAIDHLSSHLIKPVNWKETINILLDNQFEQYIEVGPTKILTSMVGQIKQVYDASKRKKILFGKKTNKKPPQQIMLNYHDNDIVAIGLACKFPEADNAEQFWRNLSDGRVSVKEIDESRFNSAALYQQSQLENKTISKWHAPIDHPEKFDNEFYNISAKDAENMDPQQRILLQEVWHCIEDSGVPLNELQNAATSVYIGAMATDYLLRAIDGKKTIDSKLGLNNYACGLANRISYNYSFYGASLSCDTACASSITALKLGIDSLKNQESDFAFIGGVNILAHEMRYIDFSKSRMLSPDGLCKTFDISANGYVQGDGVGVVLLTRLAIAKKLNCQIYGVVKSAAIQHMGHIKNITAPSVKAQKSTIQMALQQAMLTPADISYVETHGTGTMIGDPIETHALREVFGDQHPLYIGAVKSNIGHVEAGAGIAGLIKVLLMLKHKQIPPSCNIQKQNILLGLENSAVQVAKELMAWDLNSKNGRCAGVSSFGFGGVNSHCILQEYTPAPSLPITNQKNRQYPFLLSAKSPQSLKKLVLAWQEKLSDGEYDQAEIRDICLSLLYGREAMSYRVGCFVDDKTALQAWLNGIDEQSLKKSIPQKVTVIVSGFNALSAVDSARQSKKMLADMVNAGLVPEKILGIDQGYAEAFYCSDVFDEQSLVAFNQGEDLAVSDAKWPLYIAGCHEMFLNKVSNEYLTAILKKALNEKLNLSSYLAAYDDLYKVRTDFAEVVDHWFNIADIQHKEVIAPDKLTASKQLIFVLAVKLGVNRIYQRYAITDIFGGQSAINELLELIGKDQLSDTQVIENLYVINDSFPPELSDQLPNKFVQAHISSSNKLTAIDLTNLINKHEVVIHIGSEPLSLPGQNVYSFTADEQQFLNNMFALWQLGLSINWPVLVGNEKFSKVDLPLYAFNEQAYWLKNEMSDTVKVVPPQTNKDFLINKEAQDYCLEIFKKTLKIDNIDVYRSVAELGIDSIVIYQLYEPLSNKLGKFPVSYFFESKTLQDFLNQLSAWLEKTNQADVPSTKQEVVVVNDELPDNDRLAVIGVAGRYPQAENLEEFWENLQAGRDCITAIPKARWEKTFDEPIKVLDKILTDPLSGGFLNNIDHFDAEFFGVAPKDAVLMDPQERLFLETAWQCFESAGYSKETIQSLQENGKRFGVFVGATYNNYQLIVNAADKKYPVSSQIFAIANRVSYYFNLKGPSIVVDTACSSSLYALHLACQSLLTHECDYALVGGVNLSLHPSKYHMLATLGFLSSDGRCRSFGDGGDGYVPAEAVGAILLTREHLATKNFSEILAYVGGTAVSHGGRANGFTVPNPEAQLDCISRAVRNAKWDAREISYVEAHGTGTSLGDPIEVQALKEVFSSTSQDKNFCAIGSVKSNIGHAEAAAGIAQITKVLLQFKHKKIVRTLLHSEQVNRFIDFDSSPFYLPLQKTIDWQKPTIQGREVTRKAGVSSFGAGGLNVHVLLEEGPQEKNIAHAKSKNIFTFSGRDFSHLQAHIKEMLSFFENNLTVLNQRSLDIAYTLQCGRDAMNYRLAIVASDISELLDKLSHWLKMPAAKKEGIYENAANYEGDDNDHDLFEYLINKNELNRIAKMWAAGFKAPWQSLYKGISIHMIGLPSRPLQGKRYWPCKNFLPEEIVSNNVVKAHDERSPVLMTAANAAIVKPTKLAKSQPLTVVEVMGKIIKLTNQLLGHQEGSIAKDVGFFEAGMDSIMVVSLLEKLRKNFAVDLPDTIIFSYQTAEKLAYYIHEALQELGANSFMSDVAVPPEVEALSVDNLLMALQKVVGG